MIIMSRILDKGERMKTDAKLMAAILGAISAYLQSEQASSSANSQPAASAHDSTDAKR
jgi:hypothetical protein